ncbi:MAG: MBL fold metallo-hydrolase [Thermoprotei archaeon]|nr:MAG: MBL fold metallo-hydrolase [Thermoprotei archaeon]
MRPVGVEIVFLVEDYAGYGTLGVVGEHGLSVLIRGFYGDGLVREVLYDTGATGYALERNTQALGISLKDVEVIALSHRHYDHSGGLIKALELAGKSIPIVSHPDLFLPSMEIGERNVWLDVGLPFTRKELEDAGGRIILLRNEIQLIPGVWWLGEIPRLTEYESPPKWAYTVRDGELVKDALKDDTGIAIDVEGFGTVVIGGCSHSGIVNIVRKASKVTKESPRVVMGGLHLVEADDARIDATIRDLKSEGIVSAYLGHCTGLKAEAKFLEEFGKSFRKIHSGLRVRFGKF